MYPHHLHWHVRVVYWTSLCVASSSHVPCLMMFVFLGSEVCLRLPSDSTSRWTPLPLASGWPLPAPTADFHRLGNRHAWRTTRRPMSQSDTGLSGPFKGGYSFPHCIHIQAFHRPGSYHLYNLRQQPNDRITPPMSCSAAKNKRFSSLFCQHML